MSQELTEIPTVVIDQEGGYKYIVAKIVSSGGGELLVIRANKDCGYHRSILFQLKKELEAMGVQAFCLGGGRICVLPEEKEIRIQGYSEEFGREPDRECTANMLREAYPDFRVVIDS